MPDPSRLVLFALASLLLAVVPGPAVLYIIGQAVHRGRIAGQRTLVSGGDAGPLAAQEERTLGRIYRPGVVVNILNPKTALFFLAFLPQFVKVDAGHVWLQLLALGALFVGIAMCSDAMYALAAGTAGELLRRSPRFLGVKRWVSGSVFVGLGVVTALSGAHRSSK